MADGREVMIVDGGLATELVAAGLDIQGDPLWSARALHTNPQAIKNVHASYLRCGADVITTVTYQASVAGFMKHLGLTSEEAEQLLHSGVQLAKDAVTEFLSESRSSGIKDLASTSDAVLSKSRCGSHCYGNNSQSERRRSSCGTSQRISKHRRLAVIFLQDLRHIHILICF
ncbi:uncharacterized protein [Narcine bancroftii]|uniref:uncharacterized protein isoform X5 n=1 Tax=Narcine bancroftii TaxID=1343680 RepID=UPI0038314676